MISIQAAKLGLKICSTDVRAQKADDSIFEIFKIIFASFRMKDKLGRPRFFQKSFLLANTNVEVVLEILFLIFSNADI